MYDITGNFISSFSKLMIQ